MRIKISQKFARRALGLSNDVALAETTLAESALALNSSLTRMAPHDPPPFACTA